MRIKAIMIIVFFVAAVLSGCVSRRYAVTEKAVFVTHDTVTQVRDVVRIDSVFIYRGHGQMQRNDTIILADTLREVRYILKSNTDTLVKIVDVEKNDSVNRSETITETKECSTWNKWGVFGFVWFCFTIVFFVAFLICKIWKNLKR